MSTSAGEFGSLGLQCKQVYGRRSLLSRQDNGSGEPLARNPRPFSRVSVSPKRKLPVLRRVLRASRQVDPPRGGARTQNGNDETKDLIFNVAFKNDLS